MSDNIKNMALATNSLEALSLANHDFSLSLYSKFNQKDGNIFYSPFSIHLVMFMASVGAAAKTFDEIVNTLHLTKNNTALDAYKELLENLNENDVLKIATGMFADNSFKIKQSYLEKTGKYLQSSLEKLDFKGNPEVQRVYINDWVQNKTNGKIKDLFPAGSIQADTNLVLANAVHFKCGWKNEFSDTQDEPFFLTPENQVNVKMMSLRKDLLYYHDGDLKYAALELPYKNFFFKMIILLPDAKDGLKDLESNLHKIKLHELSNKMTTYNVNVKLPRFKLEQTFDLIPVLTELGCTSMFSQSANFSEIYESTSDSLYVSKVIHKAYIDLDEKGTEAAAATGIGFALLSAHVKHRENAVFIADHPFIFAIITNEGDVIFMGRLKKP
ncbi:leukocyte elastase inhibitor-like isoform X2 [Adelges cooleyi]|uniref:leukocyte elastase inhibitor-like isoform X2 n=1 Tax=Adelges cooleyi TaxID=133065 RepID=UPI00217FAAA9|nr:leukocyte elastase inhibitor-like isoform X2 [Adelges cooleyi]